MVKTQTYEQSYSSKTEHERPTESSWDTVGAYVTSLANESDFIAFTEAHDIKPQTREYADAFANYAESAIDREAELMDDTTATQIRIVANAPHLAYISQEINELKERRKTGGTLPSQEWNRMNSLKEQTVWYNQLLNGYMYDHPDDSFSALSQATTDQVLDAVPLKEEVTASKTITGVLRGARTEAAARHLLHDAHVPIRAATPEEDRRGADAVVADQYYIDFKSSLDQLAEHAGGYDFADSDKRLYHVIPAQGKRHAKIMLYAGFTDEDLGDSLKLSEAKTQERSMIIAVQLQRAINELNAA